MTRYSPSPGEFRTIVIVWDVDDARRKGDSRYWWTEGDVERLRRFDQVLPIRAGTPRGQSLGSLLERAENGWVTEGPLGAYGRRVVISLVPWADADPERTRFIIQHQFGTPADVQDRPSPLPVPVEEARQQLRAAIELGDEEQVLKSRERLTTVFREHGGRPATDLSPWDPERAVEIQPGVFIQDERLRPAQGA